MTRRKLVHRILLWSLVAIAGIALVLAVIYVIEDRLGRRAWERYEASAQQRGVKLSQSEFIAPDVPEAENFAAIPIFRDAFKANPQAVPDPFRAPGEDPRWYDSSGKPTDLAGWHKRLIQQNWLDQPSNDPVADLRRVVERHEPALEQLRAASGRPHARFGNDWSDWHANQNPHFAILQNAVIVLSLRMRVNLAAGNSEGALGDWQLGQRLCRSIEHEPTMVSGLVRVAIRQLLVESTREGLATHRWAAPELRTIAAHLHGIRVLDDYTFVIQSERAFINMFCDNLTQTHEPLPNESLLPDPARIPAVISAITSRIYPPGWVRQSQLRLNELFDTMRARVNPNTGRVDTAPLSDLLYEEMYDEAGLLRRLRHQLAYVSMPIFGTVEAKFVSHHTLIEQARLGCALELHRLESGLLPSALGELVPRFLPAIPVDVWSGEPLRYQRTENGYRLWAVGEDRKDDGGVFDPAKKARQQKDVIWEIP